jgi:hypothetical protein
VTPPEAAEEVVDGVLEEAVLAGVVDEAVELVADAVVVVPPATGTALACCS